MPPRDGVTDIFSVFTFHLPFPLFLTTVFYTLGIYPYCLKSVYGTPGNRLGQS